jgi:hypothetical protein
MSALFKSASLSSSALRASLLGLGLAMGVGFATGPAKAGDSADCVYGSKAAPAELILACGAIIENNAASRTDAARPIISAATTRRP